jgi:hypothetical protein
MEQKDFIMNYGDQQPRSTQSPQKIDISSTHSNLPTKFSRTPPEVITSKSQVERVQVFKRVEQSMESFRSGQASCFQTLTNVIDKQLGATNKDRKHALNSYLPKLNTGFANENRNGNGSTTQPSQTSVPLVVFHKQPHPDGIDPVDHHLQAGNEEEKDEPILGRK